MGILAFGVLAPGARQGTTLEKNHGPDTGTVMGRKTLDIENHQPLLVSGYNASFILSNITFIRKQKFQILG
jgi:hypothetical protein